MSEKKLAYSVMETASMLGIGKTLAYELVRKGKIPSIKLGRRIIIPRMAIENLLYNRHTQDIRPENKEVEPARPDYHELHNYHTQNKEKE